jgi:hypothetical protein
MTEHKFCGYSCGEKMDAFQEILDETIDFSKYNPEFAPEMLDRFENKIKEARAKLHKPKKK